jgi:hypothetical protein
MSGKDSTSTLSLVIHGEIKKKHAKKVHWHSRGVETQEILMVS